jgi:hypothetical protein
VEKVVVVRAAIRRKPKPRMAALPTQAMQLPRTRVSNVFEVTRLSFLALQLRCSAAIVLCSFDSCFYTPRLTSPRLMRRRTITALPLINCMPPNEISQRTANRFTYDPMRESRNGSSFMFRLYMTKCTWQLTTDRRQ